MLIKPTMWSLLIQWQSLLHSHCETECGQCHRTEPPVHVSEDRKTKHVNWKQCNQCHVWYHTMCVGLLKFILTSFACHHCWPVASYCWQLEYDYVTITVQSRILKPDSIKVLLTYNGVLLSFVINCLDCCLTRCLLHIKQTKRVFVSIGLCEMCGIIFCLRVKWLNQIGLEMGRRV